MTASYGAPAARQNLAQAVRAGKPSTQYPSAVGAAHVPAPSTYPSTNFGPNSIPCFFNNATNSVTRNNPHLDALENRSWRYIPTVPAGAHVALVETIGAFGAEHEATFEYQSIGGRSYRSTIQLNQRVITSFKFEETSIKG